jgi:hypothetical protein
LRANWWGGNQSTFNLHPLRDHSSAVQSNKVLKETCAMPMNAFGIRTAVTGKPYLPVLPSFFVIGPPRTGTSWLHKVLGECARLPRSTKETRFFDKHFGRGLAWYASHYGRVADGRVVGEIAPTYFASTQARERIARLVPQAKVVCTFRNPVDRIISLYQLKRAYGLIPWNFDEALARDPELMESSRYSTHLRKWQKTFGKLQVMVTIHEDLLADPQGYLNKLVDFVGAPRVNLGPSQMSRVFTSESMTQPRNYRWTRGAVLMADWSKRKGLGAIVEAAKRLGVMKFFVSGGPAFPELPSSLKTQLRERFRSEVEELEAMLTRDLSAWK